MTTMRMHKVLWWLAPLALAAACSGDDPAGTGGGAPGGGGQGGTVSDGGGGAGGMGGEPAENPYPCDPIAQNCVLPDASKCATIVGDDGLDFRCTEPLGDDGIGESCTLPNDQVGEDTCAPGLFCAFSSVAEGEGRICRRHCASPDDCGPDDGFCLNIQAGAVMGICLPTCDPLGDGSECAAGNGCTLFGDIEGHAQGICRILGNGVQDDACGFPTNCAQGFGCIDDQCSALCDDTQPCPDEGSCRHVTNTTDIGYCTTMDWSCAGNPMWDLPTMGSGSVEVTVSAIDLQSGIMGATVKACAAADADCAAPLDTQTSDQGGKATLTVPFGATGFDGYFQIERLGYPVSLLYPSRPMVADGESLEGALIPNDLLMQLGYDDGSRGNVLVRHVDCDGALAGQLTLASDLADATSLVEYPTLLSGGIPQPNGSAMNDGIAAIGLHPAGLATLTTTAPASGLLATRSVLVRAGAVTVVHMEPTN